MGEQLIQHIAVSAEIQIHSCLQTSHRLGNASSRLSDFCHFCLFLNVLKIIPRIILTFQLTFRVLNLSSHSLCLMNALAPTVSNKKVCKQF